MTQTAPSAPLPGQTEAARPDPFEWPAAPWDCAAPESYLLLHFKNHEAKQALKLGVIELIARKRLVLLEVARRRPFGRTRLDSALAAGISPRQAAPLADTLQPLLEVFEALRAESLRRWVHPGDPAPPVPFVMAVYVTDFARAAVQEFGSVSGYLSDVVRPALEQRGWVYREPYKLLGFIPMKRWALTPAGLAAQGDLLWRVEYGNRELGRLVDDDPTRAVGFLGLAGAAVLLMDDARPHLQRLRDRLQVGAQDTASTAGATTWTSGDPTTHPSLDTGPSAPLDAATLGAAFDPGALDLSALDSAMGGLDLGALDSLDVAFDAMDAVDAGVDAGADGGGGDGGGGDGGGGGGGE